MDNLEQEYYKRRIASLELEINTAKEKQLLLMNKNIANERKIRNMEAIFSANQHETLERIVDKFINEGRVMLKKISQQVNLMEFDMDNEIVLQRLIDYLAHVEAELANLKEKY